MAKKKPKKKKKAPPRSTPSSAQPRGDARLYQLKKATKALKMDRRHKAEDALERAWPAPRADEEERARLEWLLRRWPQRALEVIEAAGFKPAWVGEALAATALSWGEGVAEALDAHLAAPRRWVEDAAALREAAEHIAAGEDEPAVAALRRLKRDSLFLDAQRFLRGLLLSYQGQNPTLALRPLLQRPGWTAPAAALLKEAGVEVELDAPARRCVEHLHKTRGLFEPLFEALRARKINRVMVELGRLIPQLPAPEVELLWREIPAVLLQIDDHPELIWNKFDRLDDAHGNNLEHIKATIFLCEYDDDDVENFDAFIEKLKKIHKDNHLYLAAIEYHSALFHYKLHQHIIDAPDFILRILPKDIKDDVFKDPIKSVERVIQLDPSYSEAWETLIEMVEHGGDKALIARTIERFVKQLPDDPKALKAAAKAALKRGAFDKGLKYARRAAEAEPLNRDLVSLQANLLHGKALKKLHAGDHKVAEALLLQAHALPHLEADSALDLAAGLDVFYRRSDPQRADEIMAAALDADPREWRYAILRQIYLETLSKKLRKWAKLGPNRPKSPASSVELGQLVQLSTELDENDVLSNKNKSIMWDCLKISVDNFDNDDEFADFFNIALSFRRAEKEHKERILILSKASNKFPMSGMILGAYYNNLMNENYPSSYFLDYKERIDLIRDSCLTIDDDHPMSGEMFKDKFDQLEWEIEHYLRKDRKD